MIHATLCIFSSIPRPRWHRLCPRILTWILRPFFVSIWLKSIKIYSQTPPTYGWMMLILPSNRCLGTKKMGSPDTSWHLLRIRMCRKRRSSSHHQCSGWPATHDSTVLGHAKVMLPKRRVWKEEQKRKCGFRRKHFSMVHRPNWVLTPLKSASFEIHISSFVHPSKSNEDSGRPNKPVWRTKNCAISHPLLNEGKSIREYSTIRPRYNGHSNDLKEMCRIGWLLSTHVCEFLR